jgi:hypothetical protein
MTYQAIRSRLGATATTTPSRSNPSDDGAASWAAAKLTSIHHEALRATVS